MALFELKQDTGSEAAAPWAPPTFKDCVAADIDAAFFEENEHADRHTVDGKDVLIVLEDDDSPQTVDFSLIVCAYDTGLDREGWQDVANIKEDIIQRVCKAPYFGGAFTVLKPITWALQEDDTHPYYFGACTLTCTAPAMTQDEQLKEYL